VERAINHQETDRIPVYDLIRNDAVIQHYGGRIPTPDDWLIPVGKAINATVDMTRSVRGPAREEEYVDEQGFKYTSRRWTTWITERPFNDLPGAIEYLKGEIQRMKAWRPDKRWVEEWRQNFMRLQAYCGETVLMHDNTPVGIEGLYYFMGWELFSYLLADDPSWVSEFLEAATCMAIRRIHAIADYELSPVAMPYGDIAAKGGPMLSPAFLRAEFMPRLKRICDAWHEHGIKCLFHSDGDLGPIVDDLVAAGVDGLNPLETTAGFDVAAVKDRYGDRLFFAGGIDVSQVLPLGTPEQVREECERMIEILARGSGYLLGSTTELNNPVPLQNFQAMIETAWANKPNMQG